MTPANEGADAEVPPICMKLDDDTGLFLQEPSSQSRYGASTADAASDISGTSRIPSAGTPRTPDCQEGLIYSLLTPPPEEPTVNPSAPHWAGGAATDSGNGIGVDAAGNAYVTGGTYSLNFPTLGAYQTSNSGQQNVFITKLNASGSLIYSTYLGGSGNDSAAAIAVDSSGDAFVTGGTTS